MAEETASLLAPDDMTRGSLKFFSINGLVINCADGARDAGTLTTEELLEFAQYAHKHFPKQLVLVHQYGLRITQYAGQDNGPHLDWRDWT